jgi:hypothetical protein
MYDIIDVKQVADGYKEQNEEDESLLADNE